MYVMPFELRSRNCLSTTDDNLNSSPVRYFFLGSTVKIGFRLFRSLLRVYETLAQITFNVRLCPIFRQAIARSAAGLSY